MKKFLIWGTYFIVLILTPLLSEVSQDTNSLEWVTVLGLTNFFTFLLTYKILLILTCTIVLLFLPNPQTLLNKERFYSEFRMAILEQIRDEIFSGNLNDKRITILCKTSRTRALWLHIKRFWDWIISKFDSKIDDVKLYWGTFISVKHRLSDEDASYKSSSVFFCHHVDYNKCEGVASVVTRSNRTYDIRDLPDIEQIDVNSVYKNQEPSEQYELLNSYMSETFLSNIRTLKNIKRKARHFFGLAICNQFGKPVGSLLIDSMEADFILDEDQKHKLQMYAALLGRTF